ncbi:hypothetical protein MIT9_P0406 [Methylomarinovum caldicuralii]|uniref:AMP-dependent synthetase/ligase domain-containing protein n=2 Tax=Methylomarinovum caldicuralii TaxID=438856 RepID=A0AAU9BX73_9GAMM|nr:hypothetical protein MIT9_P0406 [Methylomarinovum caldicuralii]
MGSGTPPEELQRRIAALAPGLPRRRPLVNLCRDRIRFTAVLLHAACRRQRCLLPPTHSPAAVAELQARFPDAVLVTDDAVDPAPAFPCLPSPWPPLRRWRVRLRLMCFTSGSSGRPAAWEKTGAMLVRGARCALAALGLGERDWDVVATTPAQHLFALETAVIWPLCSRLRLTAARPFYPEDIRRLLARSPRPVLLVSTPLQLRACLGSAPRWRNLAGILSATAPLDPGLAQELETATGRPVWEIYGSTETQSLAWRHPAREEGWRPYPGVRLDCGTEGVTVRAPWLPRPVVLADRFEPLGDGRLRLLGRSQELIKVGGKRIALGELNHHLQAIDGVEDGLFFPTETNRVGALVVSRLDRRTLLARLRQRIDPVFLPRPLLFVEAIPRTPTGKVRQADLEALLSRLRRR